MAVYFIPYLHLLLLGVMFAFLMNVSELAAPYIMKVVIDEYIMAQQSNTPVTMLGLVYFILVIVGSLSSYIKVLVLNYAGQNILHHLRIKVFSHLQHMPLSYFDTHSTGRIVTRVTNDIEALNSMYTGVVVQLFQDIFLLLGILVVMLKLNVRLTVVSASVVPVIILVIYLFNKKARRSFERVRKLIGSINGFIGENISGMKIVQLFGAQQEKLREFQALNSQYRNASITRVVVMGLFRPSSELINALAISILLWFYISDMSHATLEIGVLFAFITYVQKIFKPIRNLSDQYATILAASVAADRIFEILDDHHTGVEDIETGMTIFDVQGAIEFKHVWFSYDNNENWVLRDISFKVNPGETVAFAGATGSGKTTIMNILARFYEIQQGEILLDGINIKNIRLKDLRRIVSVVMQDVFLFSGDIQSNIRLNNDEISGEEVIKAAKYVNAHDFIKELPERYKEEVKERGCTLSTGQRQLLAFARAITFQPRIMVLDEATANIDTKTEKIIQDSLARISQDKTILVVAHRLSTIENADKIVVLHKGRIREMGDHAELLKKGGIYRSLYQLQYAHRV